MINAFGKFIGVITDFVYSLLPVDLGAVIIAVIGVVLALAAWRIVS